MCNKPVRCNQKGLRCDNCESWLHCRCIGIKSEIYQALASSDEEWICYDCALPRFSDSFFEIPPAEESATFEPEVTIPSIDASNRNKSSNSLRCLLFNARSLRNKVLDLKTLLLEEHFPVIAITETWLDAGFMDFELGLKDYSIHRRDRQDRRGGGVLLAVHRNLISIRRRRDLETDRTEIAMVEICQKSKDNVLFGVCYRPPNAKMEYSVTLRQSLERIDMTRFATCFLVGDFNFPCIDWHTISPTSTDALTLDFCSLLNDHFLVQCNFNPTRIAHGTANILDLILTRTPDLISNIEVLPEHFDSDHLPVAFDIKMRSGRSHKSAPRQVYNYKKANFTELNELLGYVPWNCAFLEDDVDGCADKVKDLLLAAADMCVPLFTVKRRTNPPWINKDLLRLIKKKKRLWRQLKTHPSEILRQMFKDLRSTIKKSIRSEYHKYLQHLSDVLKENPKRFWSYHSIKTKSKRLPDISTYNGIYATKPQEQANLLNIHFHSVFCKESSGVPSISVQNLRDDQCVDHYIDSVSCNINEVQRMLQKLDANKTSGVDKIPARLLKETAHMFAVPLSMLYNLSFKHGQVPELWKHANVTPIHKDGDREPVEHYTGISLLTIPGKCQERIVYNAVYRQVIEFIHSSHHGFLNGRSCTTQLLLVHHGWSKALDNSGQVDVVFIDFYC